MELFVSIYIFVYLCFFLGYLAVSLFLNESHELLLLLVNTVLKVSVCLIIKVSVFGSQ